YTISGLNSGSYDIEVFDVNGCTMDPPLPTIIINPPMQVSTDPIVLLDCELPAPAGNAEIEIEVTEGSGTYNYVITGPGDDEGSPLTALPSNPYIYSGATTAGTYTITVYDMGSPNTCPLVLTEEVPARLEPTITIDDFSDVTCQGADDGTITASVIDNGTGPYSFEIIAT